MPGQEGHHTSHHRQEPAAAGESGPWTEGPWFADPHPQPLSELSLRSPEGLLETSTPWRLRLQGGKTLAEVLGIIITTFIIRPEQHQEPISGTGTTIIAYVT